jgi:hypothetical protein
MMFPEVISWAARSPKAHIGADAGGIGKLLSFVVTGRSYRREDRENYNQLSFCVI